MTPKQFLQQARRLDERINSYATELNGLRGLTALAPSGSERVQTSTSCDRMINTIEKIISLEVKINAELDRLIDLKTDIHNKIEAVLDQDERLMLRMRYLQYMEWEQIAEALHWSLRYIYKLHGKALLSIEL